MRAKALDLVYFALPLALWPLSFMVLKGVFIFALTASTALLAAVSFYRYRIRWLRVKKEVALLAGVVGAVLLYALFLVGHGLTGLLSLNGFVSSVYTSIYGSQGKGATTVVLLALIGVFEEMYWRGGLQGYVERNSKRFRKVPWLASMLYYTLVHISTLNPILVVAAFVVGIVTSVIAQKFGIISSIISHVAWIELVVIILPL